MPDSKSKSELTNMRIAFVGKGGSGKTTLSAAFIQYISKSRPVFAIDADVNVNLKNALTFSGQVRDIGHSYTEIADYVKGERNDLKGTTIVATTPPSLRSRFIRLNDQDEFLIKYTGRDKNIRLLSIGTYRETDIGHTCYHGKLNTLELIYHHLLDGKEDMIVADATAGIDNLGTSLFFAYDVNVFVVEPTQKSIDIYLEFEKISRPYRLNTVVILNKVEKGDMAFVQKYIEKGKIIGSVPQSPFIKQFEQGNFKSFHQFIMENKGVWKKLNFYFSTIEKDWQRYYELLLETHKKNSVEWWNNYYRQPIDQQFDPEFNYQKVI